MNWITTAKKRVKKRKDFSDGISKNRHLASTNIDSIQRHPQINNSQFAPSLSSAFSSQIKQNNSISNDVLYLGKRKSRSSSQPIQSITKGANNNPWNELELTPPDYEKDITTITSHCIPRTPFGSSELTSEPTVEQSLLYFNDGVQCSVNNNGTKTTKAKEQRQQPFNRETHSTVNRDTFMYSPALQLKQSIDERKRKESVRSAMKEISDMLSPIDDSSQLEGDYFCHVDAVMNGSQSVENNENNYNFQYQNQNRSAHECPQTDDMMQVESQASNDPLMTLCEAAGEQVELGRDQDSELWGTLPHPCNVGHNWVLFGGEVRLSVPTPVQPMSSLSNRSEGVYPATWTQTNDYDDGDMLAAPEVPASRSYSSAVDHCDSQNSNHVASMFPGLLPPEPTMNHYHMNNTLSHMAAEDGRSEVFSERGETLEALCSFLFSP